MTANTDAGPVSVSARDPDSRTKAGHMSSWPGCKLYTYDKTYY